MVVDSVRAASVTGKARVGRKGGGENHSLKGPTRRDTTGRGARQHD